MGGLGGGGGLTDADAEVDAETDGAADGGCTDGAVPPAGHNDVTCATAAQNAAMADGETDTGGGAAVVGAGAVVEDADDAATVDADVTGVAEATPDADADAALDADDAALGAPLSAKPTADHRPMTRARKTTTRFFLITQSPSARCCGPTGADRLVSPRRTIHLVKSPWAMGS